MNIEITKTVNGVTIKERIEGITTYNEAETALLIIDRIKKKEEDASKPVN